MNLIGNKDKDMKCITSLAFFLIASVGMAQGVPNTFTAGTPARAAEVNANFANLETRANGLHNRLTSGEAIVDQLFAEINFELSTSSAAGVSAALCPQATIPIAASCSCVGDLTTINLGMLFTCELVSDGVVAGCFLEPFTFDPGLADSTAIARATCVSAVLVDGTPATVARESNQGVQKLSLDSETAEEAAIRLQNLTSIQRNAIKLRQ